MPSDTAREPYPSVEPPSWSYFRDGFENASPVRSPAWRRVGLWAVDRLSQRLGDEWPRHAWQKNGQLPGGMAWATGHSVAYFEMIELALWLETLCDREGFAALLRSLKRDPREDVIPHLRLELDTDHVSPTIRRSEARRQHSVAAKTYYCPPVRGQRPPRSR